MKSIAFSVCIGSIIFLSNCGIYGFTGASISPTVKTISIQTFYNNAPLGPSNMTSLFTEAIKDYYQQNTSLALVDDNGDLQIDGYISNYQISPVTANANSGNGADYASQSRITITVFASYINTQDDQYDFERKFSFFVDYDNKNDLSSNEQGYVEQIFDQIILDIFNASVANW
jgi:hypothetical protein